MPQSLSRIWLHVVFSTKGRAPFLQDSALRDEMFKMLGHHANQLDCTVVRVGGWVDHVHVLCGLSRTLSVAKLIEGLKRETSKWAKDRDPTWRDFYWQNGYGAFSVSESLLETVRQYVENQAEHHRRLTYQEEFRALCAKHHIEIDERYVWD